MNLGTFSISLAVKDLKRSQAFYEKLGFQVIDGSHITSFNLEEGQDWAILKNGDAVIGLFQGMFDTNTITFNPPDVRSVQKRIKGEDIQFEVEANEDSEGPAAAMLFDPDGNPILLDQHE